MGRSGIFSTLAGSTVRIICRHGSTNTETRANGSSVIEIAEQIARQLDAKGPGQKVRRVIVIDLE